MNFTLQLHGERLTYGVPSGLYELMSDITREVLRDQPPGLYQYISEYLDTLVKVRAHARTASLVLGDILDDSNELLVFVRSMGVSWDEANANAVKIQRAFRRYQAKGRLKEAVAAVEEQKARKKKVSAEVTPSYVAFVDRLPQKQADGAATKIKATYKTYKAKEAILKMRKTSSSHTIDDISPKIGARDEETPPRRDSDRLVYEQSTKSRQSSWSRFEREASLGQRSASRLVYQDKAEAIDDTMAMPSYYDSRRKIPMISETGQIVKEEERSVVTLFSTDSVDNDQRTSFELEMPPLALQYEAEEIFEVIDKTKRAPPQKSSHGLLVDQRLPASKAPSSQLSAKGVSVESKASRASILGSKKTQHSSKSRVEFNLDG